MLIDQRCTMHYVMPDYNTKEQTRVMQRTSHSDQSRSVIQNHPTLCLWSLGVATGGRVSRPLLLGCISERSIRPSAGTTLTDAGDAPGIWQEENPRPVGVTGLTGKK